MTTSIYKRLGLLLIKYWPVMLASTAAAFVFVFLNSASIWLTATLINNILADFDKIVKQQELWALADTLTANEKLKYWTNLLILRGTPVESLKVLCLTILSVFFAKNIFFYIKNILLRYVQLELVKEIRDLLYKHLHTLSLGYFHARRSGEISSVVINDVEQMKATLSVSFQKLFVEPINILAFTSLLFIISWKLALIAIFTLPAAGFVILYVGRSIRRKSRRTQEKIANIMSILLETLSSVRIVKAFVMEKEEIRKFTQEGQNYFILLFRRAKLDLLAGPITESLGVIIGVVLLWTGGMEVISQQGINAEDFIRFILIMFSVLGPIKLLSNVNVRIQMGLASAERVFNLLDTPVEIIEDPAALDIKTLSDGIEFEKVHFEYSNGDERVLNDVSFKIKKGEIVALVGPSGAGKSTIADLIPRFFDVSSGIIKINGIDIRKLKLDSLRNLMGIVNQEVILFNDTVANNIAYGMKDFDLDKIKRAAEAANASDFIKKMPAGFDSFIGDKGVKLSGGQKQRLAIARALLKNPPILILDEATSALDTESEKKVQKAIEILMQDRTALIIAHRLSTVQNASRILVLNKGRIIEEGTHTELYAKGGLYRRLYDIQFEGNSGVY